MVHINTLEVTLNTNTFTTFAYLFLFEIQALEYFNCTLHHIWNPCRTTLVAPSDSLYKERLLMISSVYNIVIHDLISMTCKTRDKNSFKTEKPKKHKKTLMENRDYLTRPSELGRRGSMCHPYMDTTVNQLSGQFNVKPCEVL